MAETKLDLSADTNYPKKFTVTYSNFSTAALTNSIELFQLPAGGVIHADNTGAGGGGGQYSNSGGAGGSGYCCVMWYE